MDNPSTIHDDQRSATEVMKEVTESSKQLFEAGERVMSDLTSLQERAQRNLDWRAQFAESPLLLLGVAFGVGLLLGHAVIPER